MTFYQIRSDVRVIHSSVAGRLDFSLNSRSSQYAFSCYFCFNSWSSQGTFCVVVSIGFDFGRNSGSSEHGFGFVSGRLELHLQPWASKSIISGDSVGSDFGLNSGSSKGRLHSNVSLDSGPPECTFDCDIGFEPWPSHGGFNSDAGDSDFRSNSGSPESIFCFNSGDGAE